MQLSYLAFVSGTFAAVLSQFQSEGIVLIKGFCTSCILDPNETIFITPQSLDKYSGIGDRNSRKSITIDFMFQYSNDFVIEEVLNLKTSIISKVEWRYKSKEIKRGRHQFHRRKVISKQGMIGKGNQTITSLDTQGYERKLMIDSTNHNERPIIALYLQRSCTTRFVLAFKIQVL